MLLQQCLCETKELLAMGVLYLWDSAIPNKNIKLKMLWLCILKPLEARKIRGSFSY